MNNILGALKGRWTLWIIALFFSFVAGFGALSILGSAADRVPYYVATADMAAGTQITADLVTEKTAPADSVPPTALTLADIQNNTIFAKVALPQGSVIQLSSITQEGGLTADLPEGFVLTTFVVPPENAVGGRVSRGSYVDIAAVSGDSGSKSARIVMQHVLIVDVTAAPPSISQAATSDPANPGQASAGSEAYVGTASLYTVAVSPEDFAKIALLSDSSTIYLALSAAQTPSELNVTVSDGQLNGGNVKPSYPLTKTSSSSKLTKTGKPVITGVISVDAVAVYNFYQKQGANQVVTNGVLNISDPKTGALFDSLDLAGGSLDIPLNGSVTYVPASR